MGTIVTGFLATMFAISAFAQSAAAPISGSASAAEPLVVFLVRHGEKLDKTKDPQLSSAGRARAAELANTLRDADIQHVHSSNYARTRDTAAPAAKEFGTTVQYYDPRKLPLLVEKLLTTGGRHLVVGHSNTTPELVNLLGGQATPDIDEATEYDRLYIVTLDQTSGSSSSVLLRYGNPQGHATRYQTSLPTAVDRLPPGEFPLPPS